MARIAILITDMFQDAEFSRPDSAFREAGHQVEHVGLHRGNMAKGLEAKISVLIDSEVDSSSAEEYDALFIPGGYSPDRLRENNNALRLVRQFMNKDKPVYPCS